MPSFPYVIVDVFTRSRFGGNQLAVFPDASKLDEALMPRIAREFNFSETTFVLPPSDPSNARRVRIFTPGGELPFAGHPTVGTAYVLALLGDVPLTGDETRIVLEEGVGPVRVSIRARDGKPGFVQLSAAQLPEFGPPPPNAAALARAVGLEERDIRVDTYSPEGASCGVPFLMVPLRDRAALARARVRSDEFEEALGGYWATKVFLFCDDPELRGSDFRARMFAPGIGVAEDPATGSACVAFGGYLAKRDPRPDGTLCWVIEQGVEMGRPSILEVEADKSGGEITAARVGGETVLVSRGEFLV